MPEYSPATAYCENCGAAINQGSFGEKDALSEKTTSLESRLTALELKIEALPSLNQIERLLTQNNAAISKTSNLVDRVIAFFPTFYITYASIIQSVALGYLLITIKGQFTSAFTNQTYAPIWIILTIATFLLIIAAWQEYMVGCSAFQWVPSLPDAIIPFLVGVSEVVAIFTIELQKVAWTYFAASIICVVGFVSYFNTYYQIHRQYERNKMVLQSIGGFPRINLIGALAFGAILLSFGVLETVWSINAIFLALVVLGMAISWVVRGQLYWNKIIKRWL